MKEFHQERVNRQPGIEMAKALLRDEYDSTQKMVTHNDPNDVYLKLGRKQALEELFNRLTDELRLIKESEDWLTSNQG